MAVRCGRCDDKIDEHRTERVHYPQLNGLEARVVLCRSCLRALDDFVNGREVAV